MTNVLVVHSEVDFFRNALDGRFPGATITCTDSEQEALARIPEADVIVSMGRWITPSVIERAKRLKWVQCTITGVDHLLPALEGFPDILLTNARGMHGRQMSEMAVLHMMALSRQLRRLAANQARHVWDRFLPRVLNNNHAVIVGIGAIAEHMVHVLKAFGMTVSGVSGTAREIEGFEAVYPYEQITEAAARADFLIALVPYSEKSRHLIGAEVFRAMKPSAFLVNLARGGVVDEKALIRALEAKEIAGAGLDVFETVPLPGDSPLWDMDNVFITPFVGGRSDQYEKDFLDILLPNLERFLGGRHEDMQNIVKRNGT